MTESNPAPKRQNKGFHKVLMVSCVVHGLFFGGFVAFHSWGANAAPKRPKNFIATKLVRLGKKRPPELLPRLEAQPAPNPKPQVSLAPPKKKSAPKKVTTAKPQKAVSALERAKSMRKMSSALDRLRRVGDAEQTGDPDGVQDGEVSQVSAAILGNKYATEIYRCLKKNYAIQGVEQSKVKGRQATLVLQVDATGKLLGAKIVKASGLAAFDRAVLRSVQRCGKVSPPPKSLRQAVGSDGIEIVYTD